MPDVSIGRVNEGEDIGMFMAPTPGDPNGDESVLGVLSELSLSHSTGFYDESSIFVGIYSEDGDVDIYYTFDGSEPSTDSYLYSGTPVYVQDNVVIRATAFKDGWLQSPVKTATYILDNVSYNFPTMFLSTAPDNFFDYYTGIYVCLLYTSPSPRDRG